MYMIKFFTCVGFPPEIKNPVEIIQHRVKCHKIISDLPLRRDYHPKYTHELCLFLSALFVA